MFEKFRIYLRALEIEDYKTTFEWRKDLDIQYGFNDKRVFVSSENEKKWIESVINDFSKVSVGVCLKENDTLIGLSFLKDIDLHNRNAQTASMIGERTYWGKGFATEAKLLMLHYAFIDRGLERIWTNILVDNYASIKMCENCGYKKEGILRKAKYSQGVLKDVYYYAVIKEDFLKIWEKFNEL
ncbi:GNAT family N-acetyltransferase [bacterium]|nr:GNAT family N-acetyltransferase [bacterium]